MLFDVTLTKNTAWLVTWKYCHGSFNRENFQFRIKMPIPRIDFPKLGVVWVEAAKIWLVVAAGWCAILLPAMTSWWTLFRFLCGLHINQSFCRSMHSSHFATDINECLALPCLNGGTCRNLMGSFQCECVQGFGGKRCQTGSVHGREWGRGALSGVKTQNLYRHLDTHVSCMFQKLTSACQSPVRTAGPARITSAPTCVTALKVSEAPAVNLVHGWLTSTSLQLPNFKPLRARNYLVS